MANPFMAEIVMFGGNFAPRGWAFCDGQLLPISQNQALFSLLGTIYGGDGRTTFQLPDLRGRGAMHEGSGAGLTQRNLGAKGGSENVTLTASQIPAHRHGVGSFSTPGGADSPTGNFNAANPAFQFYNTAATAGATMNANMVNNTGGGQSHTNVMPFQCVNFIIALQGTYPSRN